jgi:hypothetical protein
LRIFFARAPAATLPMVSLADDRPPPYISVGKEKGSIKLFR